MVTHQIVLFYQYVPIKYPENLRDSQRALCQELGLLGRILISKEGINATLEGTTQNIEKYIIAMRQDDRFKETQFKLSEGNGEAFPKLEVKVRSEIVTSSLGGEFLKEEVRPAPYIMPDELYRWFEEEREFYIVDMRNDYEFAVGHFENSIFSGMKNFRNLPEIIKDLEHLKEKQIITVCTGGVRCEKASAFLLQHGFKNVRQLWGGIVTFMEKYPNEHFKGKLYVFDGRVIMGFNTNDPKHEIVGRCENCRELSEHYVNCANDRCHRHYICCHSCILKFGGLPFCTDDCQLIEELKI